MGLQFPAPFYDILVVPTGASSGARIVIDGTTGTIEIYDSSNDLRIRMGMDASFIEFLTGDADEETTGLIGTVIASGFPSDRLLLELQSPGFGDTINDQDHSTLRLYGGTRDGTSIPPEIRTSLGLGTLLGGGFADNVCLGRGIVARMIPLTGNSSGFTADSTTDMGITNVTVHDGNVYDIHCHTRWDLSAAGLWTLECHVNGTKIGEFGTASGAGAAQGIIDGTVEWDTTATAVTDDITVVANEELGAATFTLLGSATNRRTLTLKHAGQG